MKENPQNKNDKKSVAATVIIDPKLSRFTEKDYFPEKTERANTILAKTDISELEKFRKG
jgi:hypothetical protein